jgi:EmrB/QacA subfamily drug resistance transporter
MTKFAQDMDTRTRWLALIVLCLGDLMIVLDSTVVNVALPSIRSDLGFSAESLAWVVNAYMLTFGGFLLLGGRLGDLYGHRRLFLAGIVFFTAASLVCGLSNSQEMLVVARAVQGLGGAVVSAVALSLIMVLFTEPADRAKAMGVFGFVLSGGGTLGVLLGGVLTDVLSWHWIFLVNIPIGVGAVALAAAQLRESSDPEHSRLDPVGLVTLTGGLLCLILALIEGNSHGWSSGLIIGLFVGAAVLLTAFVIAEAVQPTSMVDLALFRRPAFVGAQVTAFAISSTIFAMFLYLTLYLQDILRLSPLQTGVRFLPLSLVSFLAAPVAGRLSARVPIRLLLGGGLALCALALWLMSGISAGSSWTTLLPGFLVGGVGIGLVNAPLASTAVSTVRQERAGMASGLNNTFRQLGIATGIAALGAIFQSKVGSTGFGSSGRLPEQARVAFVAGLNAILEVGAVVAAVGAVLALLLVRRKDFVASGPPQDGA